MGIYDIGCFAADTYPSAGQNFSIYHIPWKRRMVLDRTWSGAALCEEIQKVWRSCAGGADFIRFVWKYYIKAAGGQAASLLDQRHRGAADPGAEGLFLSVRSHAGLLCRGHSAVYGQ